MILERMEQMDPEKRAPGWRVRCLKCGFTDHWGKYAIRIGAASWKKCVVMRCRRCKKIGCHMVEKRSVEPENGEAAS